MQEPRPDRDPVHEARGGALLLELARLEDEALRCHMRAQVWNSQAIAGEVRAAQVLAADLRRAGAKGAGR